MTTGTDNLGTAPFNLTDPHFAMAGHLSRTARQAAIERSLPLLGVYFAEGTHEQTVYAAASRSHEDALLDDALTSGLRLRIALAAAEKLIDQLTRLTQRPTFRYTLAKSEQVGALSGTLDVARWSTERFASRDALTYPTVDVVRGTRTPENTLAVYAARWITRELTASLRASTARHESIEYLAARRVINRLDRLTSTPALRACRTDAEHVRTGVALRRLIGSVRSRLRRREVAYPAPYLELADWIERCLDGGPTLDPGDIDLSAYGSQFDTKLYELWCVQTLADSLAVAFEVEATRPSSTWRQGDPVYMFETFAGVVDLYFQRSVTSVDNSKPAVWTKEPKGRLGGIPDIILRIIPSGHSPQFIIVDPKLRQRSRVPSD